MRSAQSLATASGLACQVSEASQIGVNAERQAIFEAACAAGPGYILIASARPQAFDCIQLKSQAEHIRARDPNADVGQQCMIAKNLDTIGVLSGYATEAGVACSVDEGAFLGKSDDGDIAYEVGCKSAPGFWLERRPSGWLATECLEVASTGGACRFTTAQEEAAAFQVKLTDTDASNCGVEQVRLVGLHANGRVYEVKCSVGDGFIALIKDGVTQVSPCSAAQGLAGGCKLAQARATAQGSAQQP